MRFRLTGDACDPTEAGETRVFKVVNKDVAHTFGAHLMVVAEGETEEQETFILPWVKVYLITPDTGVDA